MVRFIVEVSEGYIEERGDLNNLMEMAKDKEQNPLGLMADYMVFTGLKKEVEEGKKEFNISSKNLIKREELEVFNRVVTLLGVLKK